MLQWLLFTEEEEKVTDKLEAFKATIIQAFPSRGLYKELYGKNDEEENGGMEIIEMIPDTPEALEDIQDILSGLMGTFVDDSQIPIGEN
jgi:hypothetical protein